MDSTTSAVAIRKNEDEVFTNIKTARAGDKYSLIQTTDNKLYVFGINGQGQLGIEDVQELNIPTLNTNIDEIMLIEAGYTHSAVALTDGSVYTCGLGTSGQLGNGESNNSSLPIEIGKKLVQTNTNNLVLNIGESYDLDSSISYFNILKDSKEEI